MKFLPFIILLAACASEPVTEYPKGPPVIPSKAAILMCLDRDRWDWKWCANRGPE